MLPRPVGAHICLINKSVSYFFFLKNDILDNPQSWLKFGSACQDMTEVSLNILPCLPHSLIHFVGYHLLEREAMAINIVQR